MVLEYVRNEEGHFVCPHCQAVKKNQSTMHYHLKKHENDCPHACKFCPKKFLQKGLLDLHMNSMHKEILEKKEKAAESIKTLEPFKCPCTNCDQTFLQKGNLRIHFMRIHMKEFSHSFMNKENASECRACQKEFKNTTAFFYHVYSEHRPAKMNPLYNEWKDLIAM